MLKLESLTFVGSSSVQHGLNYSTLSTTDQEKLKQVLYILDHSSSVQHGVNYNTLSATDQEKMKQVLYILDRFYVFDACYSELFVVGQTDCQTIASSNNSGFTSDVM